MTPTEPTLAGTYWVRFPLGSYVVELVVLWDGEREWRRLGTDSQRWSELVDSGILAVEWVKPASWAGGEPVAKCEECAALRRDNLDVDRLNGRLASILSRTADALKGDPGPLRLHSWHDLPEVAAALRDRAYTRVSIAAAIKVAEESPISPENTRVQRYDRGPVERAQPFAAPLQTPVNPEGPQA